MITLDWWALAITLYVGLLGGFLIGRYALREKTEQDVTAMLERRAARHLAENGRTRPRHPDATTAARVTRARPRRPSRNRLGD